MHAMQDQRGAPLTARQAHEGAEPDRRKPRLAVLALLVALATLVVDQATKVWALRSLTPGEPIDLLGEVIRLNIIRNPGAAFSIGNQVTWLLTLLSLVILVVILASIRRLGHTGWAVCLGLLLGGAVGNLIDRILREPGVGRGHVIDFIDYGGLFVGNVADIAIVVAASTIAVLAWRGVGLDGGRVGDTDPDRAGPDSAGPHETDAGRDGATTEGKPTGE